MRTSLKLAKNDHSNHSSITYTYLKVDQVLSYKGALKSSTLHNSQRHEGAAGEIHVLQGVGLLGKSQGVGS